MNSHLLLAGKTKIDSPFSPFNIFCENHRNRRLELLEALHRGKNPDRLECDRSQVSKDLELLMKADLVKKKGQTFYPSFFMVLAEETQFIPGIAREIAQGFFSPIQDWFSEIRNRLNHFSREKNQQGEALDLIVIGYYIMTRNRPVIDKSLGDIITTSPPERTGGQYFFQVIQTDYSEFLGRFRERGEQVGKYYSGLFGIQGGPEQRALPPLGFFPLYKQLGVARGKKLAREVLAAYRDFCSCGAKPPGDIIPFLENLLLLDSDKNPRVPFLTKTDEEFLDNLGQELGKKISLYFSGYSSSLLNTFYSLPASEYASFSEFYDWFYHLIVDNCLERLWEKGLLSFPDRGYQPFIIFREDPE